MSLFLEIPFTSKEGYEYLIRFSEFSSKDKDYGLPIVDISIILMSYNIETNSLSTLNFFTTSIDSYLSKNNVILYYYCDRAPIQIRKNRNITMIPQEYRSRLFKMMFNKSNKEKYYLKEIIVIDNSEGNHFLALLSRVENRNIIEFIEQDIQTFNK